MPLGVAVPVPYQEGIFGLGQPAGPHTQVQPYRDKNHPSEKKARRPSLDPREAKESSDSGVELEQATESVATANGPALGT